MRCVRNLRSDTLELEKEASKTVVFFGYYKSLFIALLYFRKKGWCVDAPNLPFYSGHNCSWDFSNQSQTHPNGNSSRHP
jgi:hypothetical protein